MNKKHGMYEIMNNPDDETELALEAIEHEIDTKEGRRKMAKRHAGLISLGIYAGMDYIVEQRQSGVPMDEIPLFRNIVRYFNSWIKHSKYLDELEPDVEPMKYAQEIEKMKEILSESD